MSHTSPALRSSLGLLSSFTSGMPLKSGIPPLILVVVETPVRRAFALEGSSGANARDAGRFFYEYGRY